MKRLIIICCCAYGAISELQGQPVSLTECLKMAVENSFQVKKAKLSQTAFELQVKEARSAIYPQINATVNYDYFPELPTQLLPGELFGRPSGSFLPVQFNQPWQLGGVIQIDQPLISESQRRSFPATRIAREIQQLLLEKTESEVAFFTTTLFYQALQADQALRSMDANLDKIKALQKMAELQLSNGYIVPTDLKRIQVMRTNVETMRQAMLNNIHALRLTLSSVCGRALDTPIEPAQPASDLTADSLQWKNLVFDIENTTEHKLLQSNLSLNLIKRKSLKAEALPSISAYATGATQTFRKDPYVFDPSRRWYGFAAVGFRAKAPIFDGFRRKRKLDLLGIEREQINLDLMQVTEAKNLEFRLARDQFNFALKTLQTQQANIVLAREITDKLMLQYKEGIAPLTDLLHAQTALAEAENTFWQQVYNYKLAVLKLLKSAGKLDLLVKDSK